MHVLHIFTLNAYNFFITEFIRVFLSNHRNNDVSHCSVGMANSQSVTELRACLTEDQTLKIDCDFTPEKQTTTPICTFEADKKVVATTNNVTKPVDPTIKNPGQASLKENKCELIWPLFSEDDGKMYNCTIQYAKPVLSTTLGMKVEKSKIYNYFYGC